MTVTTLIHRSRKWWLDWNDRAPPALRSGPLQSTPTSPTWSLFVSDDLGRCQLWLMRGDERWARLNPTWEAEPHTERRRRDAACNERQARERGEEIVRRMTYAANHFRV